MICLSEARNSAIPVKAWPAPDSGCTRHSHLLSLLPLSARETLCFLLPSIRLASS
ncbi:hypothetical protein D3C81_2163210 [compost metagenome]